MSITVEEMNNHAKIIREKEAEYDAAKKISTDLYKELERLEGQMGKMLLDLGQNTFETPYGKMILTERVSFKVPAGEENRKLLFDYLKERDLFDSFITVPYNTLNAWAKEELAQAEDKVTFRIPGLELPTISRAASLRK